MYENSNFQTAAQSNYCQRLTLGVQEFHYFNFITCTDEELMDIIAKIDIVYQNKCENISLEVLKHPLLEEEIGKEHIGNTASKHLVQNSSLLGHLQKLSTFEVSFFFSEGKICKCKAQWKV